MGNEIHKMWITHSENSWHSCRNSSPITKTAAGFCNFHYTTKASSIPIVPLHRRSAAAEKNSWPSLIFWSLATALTASLWFLLHWQCFLLQHNTSFSIDPCLDLQLHAMHVQQPDDTGEFIYRGLDRIPQIPLASYEPAQSFSFCCYALISVLHTPPTGKSLAPTTTLPPAT